MISATLRLRLKPCLPVEQNVQFSAQPAWVETHNVPRGRAGAWDEGPAKRDRPEEVMPAATSPPSTSAPELSWTPTGMYTASTALPVPTFSSHLREPSSDNSSRITFGAVMHARCASLSRNAAAMSVIAAKSGSPAL